jgi:hypothetical protein
MLLLLLWYMVVRVLVAVAEAVVMDADVADTIVLLLC